MKWKKWKNLKQIISWILCITILGQSVPVYAVDMDAVPYTFSDVEDGESQDITQDMESIDKVEESTEENLDFGSQEAEPDVGGDDLFTDGSMTDQEPLPDSETEYSNVYENGIIKIYNQSQLYAIGSGQSLRMSDDLEDTYGTGNEVIENGTVITYSMGAQYQLMNDIELNVENLWQLPEGFTGMFISEPVTETDPLYNPEMNTVYVYHKDQLLAIASEEMDKKPITSRDMFATDFGMGQFMYPSGDLADKSVEAVQDYLTYSKEHRYVLSKKFTGSQVEVAEPEYSNVYENGTIKIYNKTQLQAIGSGQSVRRSDDLEDTYGTGEEVTENGTVITYSLEAQYQLMNDIELDVQNLWQLPEGFTGKFLSEPVTETDPLYDPETDTIYIYHIYQLLTMASEGADTEPIMSGDMIATDFGMGQFLYKNGKPADESVEAAQDYLTYSKEHRYVLSKKFSEQMPELLANTASDTYPLADERPDGRTYPGQVTYHDQTNGKDYILIGNETQLRAIGSNKFVTPRLYLYINPTGLIHLGKKSFFIPYYPGDADLGMQSIPDNGKNTNTGKIYSIDKSKGYIYKYNDKKQTEIEEYKLADVQWNDEKGLLGTILQGVGDIVGGILGIVGGILGKTEQKLCGVNSEGIPDLAVDQNKLQKEYKNCRYTSDANYIIFRDIDLSSTGINSDQKDNNWMPLMLSGNMKGQKEMAGGLPVTISNVNVQQTGKLDPSTTRGLGFFGSISSQIDENNFGHSKGTTVVENIHLQNVTINNQSEIVKPVDLSLVKILLGTVGGLLAGLGFVIEGILDLIVPGSLGIRLDKVIWDLLTIQQARPDTFAVGCFAGRITGDVNVKNCAVEQASVSNVKDMTGGFVGYTEGNERYDGLSQILGGTVKVLSKLLNIIPGIGLGDLITVLLNNNIINAGQLFPVGYYKPTIENCSVSLATGTVGTDTTKYNGGFVGMQVASNLTNCTVNNVQRVEAMTGAGGFAGIERDAVIDSLLTNLGVNLVTFDIKSKQESCTVNGANLAVNAIDSYAGGFNGVMTNSISKGCTLTNLSKVSAVHYAGGFAGRATIGYGIMIGDGDEKKKNLLAALAKIVEGLISGGNDSQLPVLLSISGMTPSELHYCNVSGNNWTVTATENYAGGLIGQGDGATISMIQRSGMGDQEVLDAEPTIVTGLASVQAKNYAGGLAGSIVTANPIGVLNNTIGVGSYLPFYAGNIQLTGSNLKITATEKYASAGFGLMLGGRIENVTINNVDTVTAQNYAGGIAGRAGAGSLAQTGGLDILGLGLIKVDNVLSLAQGVNVKVKDTHITGVETGAVISATGTPGETTSKEEVFAGGLVSEADGMQVKNTDVSNIKEIKAEKNSGEVSYAGGFIGKSHTGGLAGLAQEESGGKLHLPGIVDVSNLLTLVPYLLPEYENCKVTFVSNGESPQLMADYAGGFFGQMDSGKVINPEQEPYAVYGIEKVKATEYAGGFAGKIKAGAAASSNGLKLLGGILNLDLNDLLSVLNVYIPVIELAGVKSADGGLTVEATSEGSSAGGYAGIASGATISKSDVDSLKHTKVEESDYFGTSSYAVKAGRYAGGYIGRADIDSAAQVGGGLKLLNLLDLGKLLSALNVVATKIEDSDVNGMIGGFSVFTNGKDKNGKIVGKSGGFMGEGSGCRIINSNVHNFQYIIGQEMAGGYAGHLEPGNVAAVLGDEQDIINGLISMNETLASLVNAFIPVIKNSETTAVPCGGIVRAEGTTDTDHIRGLAGGYVGYNHGAKIEGNDSKLSGSKKCAVVRLRSVYGREAAGGFTGLMENADLAGTGNLKLLFGLVSVNNVLGLLKAVYPTETNTAVYGPLRKMDVDTWNKWADAVAANGVYGAQFPADKVADQTALNTMIPKYAYGYDVTAGRTEAGNLAKQLGDAGGYVGKMQGGVITEAHAWDTKSVTAYKSAGGFAGEMITGGVAEVGNVSLANGALNILGSISAVQTFVPVIRNSDVSGFQSGLIVNSHGIQQQGNKVEKVGYAGGYAGHVVGGQIWGNWKTDSNTPSTFHITDAVDSGNNRCFVDNLRQVNGTSSVGGFAGLVEPGGAASLDTAGKGGLLDGLLQNLIKTPEDLVQILNATMSTIEAADVKAWDAYGITVNGVYSDGTANTQYAKAVGGFAGELQGTVIGKLNHPEQGATVTDLRSVTGGKHAGGFFGYADVSSVAEISNSDGAGNSTSIIGSLIGLDSITALDSFRTFIYDSKVSGVKDAGLSVEAKEGGSPNTPLFTGNAGGFGGSLCNGSVKGSSVENLWDVEGKNYVGGFIGHLDKGGVLQADNIGLLEKFLSAGADVLSVFGSHVDNCNVVGISDGFTVRSENTAADENKDEIVGGFAGYADLARMKGNTVENLKQVASEQTAGGFVGKTSFKYLAEIKVDSPLVNKLVDLLRQLLKAIWLEDIQQGSGIEVDLGIIKVDVISKEDGLLHVNLLGLDIGIELVKTQSGEGLAKIHIGDSVIEINCANDGTVKDDDKHLKDEIHVSLIKANRTRIEGCTVTGIQDGYDVYGGCAGNDRNGAGEKGCAGGFVGYNDEGLLKKNEMYLADVIRGTEGITGPFSGKTNLNTNTPEFINSVFKIEGEDNHYRIYRTLPDSVDKGSYNKVTQGVKELQNKFDATESKWNIYEFHHRAKDKVEKFDDLKNAVLNGTNVSEIPLDAYMENGAMAVLMDNTPTTPSEPGGGEVPPDVQDPCKDTVQLRIRKVWKNDKEADRPEKIVVHITRSYIDAQNNIVQDTVFNSASHQVELTKKDYQSKNVWEKVISGVPFTAYYTDADGTKRYYTYEVTEDALDGYKTTITYKGEYQYDITITNRKKFTGILPNTGGTGTFWIYTIGTLVLLSMTAMELASRRKKKQVYHK